MDKTLTSLINAGSTTHIWCSKSDLITITACSTRPKRRSARRSAVVIADGVVRPPTHRCPGSPDIAVASSSLDALLRRALQFSIRQQV